MIQGHQIQGKSLQYSYHTTEEPVFSIITATYNCKLKLDKTVQSVLSQSFTDFEYLLIDGASKDGSQEWLAGIKDPRVRVVSEPDKGVYDAMNRGIQRARGKFLYFLGAGDELLPGALQEISHHLPKENLAMIYGNVFLAGDVVYDGEFSKLKLCDKNISHQAIFCGRDVFKELGNFEVKYKTYADWVFNMKCFGDGRIQIHYVPITIAIFEPGGMSCKGDPIFDADRQSVMREHFGEEFSNIGVEFTRICEEKRVLQEEKRTLSEKYIFLVERNKSLLKTFRNLCELILIKVGFKQRSQ